MPNVSEECYSEELGERGLGESGGREKGGGERGGERGERNTSLHTHTHRDIIEEQH